MELTVEHLYVINDALAGTYQLWHGLDKQEIESAANWGLYKAWKAYDPNRGASFKTYSRNKCKWEILSYIHELNLKKNRRIKIVARKVDYFEIGRPLWSSDRGDREESLMFRRKNDTG
jgi:DNA-directed RNA polymerase sigma subunit (sigma70/sigma32)